MTVWINEFHYDNSGASDIGEFIELAGTAGTSLTGWSIVRYNGSTASAAVVYTSPGAISLTGIVIPNLSNGFGTVSFALPTDGLQNGGNDGFALVNASSVVVELLSYEGVFTAASGTPAGGLTSTDVGVSETNSTPAGSSIHRIGTGSQASDFTWALTSDDTPGAINTGQTFVGVGGDTQVSINDVVVVEGSAGTSLLTFTVTRSATTGAFSVDFATADGTATTVDNDYLAASGTLNFTAGGAATQTISVTINGDVTAEVAESFAVNLSNLVNTVQTAVLSDSSGTGTITNDDVSTIAIHDIQGAAHTSPFLGQTVTTTGIVTAVDSNGFYLQAADADADASLATSEAIFVFTGSAPTVAVGNAIQLSGVVSEFFPGGAATGNLSTTQLGSIAGLVVLSTGNALPTAIILGAGGRQAPTENIEDDGLTSFDPVTDGIDFFESLEAMRVTVPTPLVVAATSDFGEIFTVADGGANATNLSARGSIVTRGSFGDGLNVTNSGAGSDFNPERLQIDADTTITPGVIPLVDVGAMLNDVTGVLGYNFGNFEVIPTAAITVLTQSILTAETTALVGTDDVLTIASYNVLNLDPNDLDGDTDIADGRFAAIALQLKNNLGSPDIIALQEVQDNSGSTNNGVVSASMTLQMLVDAIIAAGGPTYTFIDNSFITNNTNGGQPGGNIRVAYLYNSDRVSLVAGSVATTPDALTDFAGSRPPLIARFEFNDEEVTVVNNHFSSKGGGTPLYGVTQPSINGSAADRLVQAQNVADYVSSLGASANVLVLGDLNEFDNEESLAPLDVAGLENLGLTLAPTERYSFTFDGNAQSLDQAYVSASLSDAATIDIVHANIEFAFTDASASDHDPSVIALNLPANAVFTLQLLHFSDGEAGTLAPQTAPNLAALVDRFEDEFANSITLAGGDTYLPGPFLAAGTDPSLVAAINAAAGFTVAGATGAAPGVVDTIIHNLIGVEASGVGNHEWDLGSAVYAATLGRTTGNPAVFASPIANYVSVTANLDFSGDSAIRPYYRDTVGAGLEEASTLKGRLVPSAVITEGGEPIGLVGVTTQILESISSPSGTEVLGFPTGPGANGETNDMVLLAAQLQPVIDDLIAQGVNKIVLLSHLQQITFEQQLATLLRGVDVIIAAGSNTRLGDADDVAVDFPGHAADFANTYPIVTAGIDGKTTLIVNTDNEYTYLGRLVVDFDANGEIILQSVTDNVAINGAYASTAENVAEAYGVAVADLDSTAFAPGTRGARVETLTDAVNSVIVAKDGNVFGFSNVYLEGERIQVRNQETNLGNVSADANADVARDALGLTAFDAVVSIKNGGGIRAQIGTIVNNPDGTVTKVAPEVGGEVSQLDIENALRFDNRLMAFDTTAQGLLNILNGPTALAPNNGGFIQIGGVSFSYDPTKPVGSRVQDVVLINDFGQVTAVIADNGVVVAGAPAVITAVALNFTANGGDMYPIKANAQNFRFLLNDGSLSAPVDEALNFTDPAVVPVNAIGEQQAFAEYFLERYATPETAYDTPDTTQAFDLRIQNQAARTDTVLLADYFLDGSNADNSVVGNDDDNVLQGFGGNDTLDARGGNDQLNGGTGNDTLNGDTGTDTAIYAGAWVGYDVSNGGATVTDIDAGNGNDGTDTLASVEFISFAGVSVAAADAVNDAPIGGNDSNAGDALVEDDDSSAAGNVLANDTDADLVLGLGETLTVTGARSGTEAAGGGLAAVAGATIVNGTYGQLTINPNGSYSYALDNTRAATQALAVGATAFESFTYRVADAHGLTDTAQLDLAITGAFDAGDPITGTNANNTLNGTGVGETLFGLGGNDTLNGNGGNDILDGGPGADRLNGGDGNDTASYASATGGVSSSLLSSSGNFGEALGDRYSSIENLTGSSFDDVLFGNASVNIIRGGAGNDTIFGNGGLDQLFGDAGDDNFVFTGAQVYASIDGGSGLDTIKAGADNTKIAIGTITGIETISSDGYANVIINGGAGNNVINLTGVTLIGIASVNGNDGLDDISGSNGDDVINGGTGNDNLRGGLGNDIIRGNNGIDMLTGGSGADIFVFSRTESGRSQPLADFITDFVTGTDKIDLSLIDANITNGSGINDAFTFIGFEEFSATPGELRINTVGPFFYIEADLNGDSRADFAVNVNSVPDLAATDFIL